MLLNGDGLLLSVAHQSGFALRNDHVVDADGQAGLGCVLEAKLLDAVEHPHRGLQTEAQVAVVHQLADAFLFEQAVDVRHLGRAALQVIVHDGAAHCGRDELTLEVGRLSVDHVLIVVRRGEVDDLAAITQTNGAECFHLARFLRDQHFLDVGEGAAFALGARLRFRQVVNAQHHVLGRNGDRLARRGRQDVVGGQHQYAGFHLRLRRQRNVHGHLVTVEVCVERGADQRVNLDCLAFHQHRFKCLNAQTVQGRSAVQQNGVIFNHLFQDVPYDGLLLLDHLLRLLDGGAMSGLLQPVIDKRLEQLQRHLLRQAALLQLELGTDHDHRTTGVVHALAQQVLAEAALLAFQRVGERLQRAIVGATQHAATTSVVEQGVHSFLQHALFIADDDFRRMQVHQLFQPIVAVDDATVEVVQVRRGKAAAVEWNQGTQLRRNNRNDVEDHPLRLIAALAEGLNHFQALGILQALLNRGLGAHLFAQLGRHGLDLDPLQQLFDCFGAHHGLEAGSAELLIQFAELGLVLDDLALFHRSFTGFDHDVGFKVEHRFKLAQRDVEDVPDTAGQSLEEPHVRAGGCQLDVAQALATDLRQRNFHSALVADHASVLHALVLAAETLPVGDRPEDPSAEQAIAFRLEGAVVDGLGLGDFAVRPATNLFRRGQADTDRVEIGDSIS